MKTVQELMMDVFTRLELELEENFEVDREREDEEMFKALFEMLEDV